MKKIITGLLFIVNVTSFAQIKVDTASSSLNLYKKSLSYSSSTSGTITIGSPYLSSSGGIGSKDALGNYAELERWDEQGKVIRVDTAIETKYYIPAYVGYNHKGIPVNIPDHYKIISIIHKH